MESLFIHICEEHQIENHALTMYDYFQKAINYKRQSKLTGYSIGKSHVGTH